MNWELIISIIAISISGFSAWYSYMQGRKSNKLQERIVDIEEKREQERLEKENRADLRTEFTYVPATGEYRKVAKQMAIKNIGKQKARNVKIFINGEPMTAYLNIFCRPSVSIGNVAEGNNQEWRIEVDEESPETAGITLRWDDDTGTNHEFKEKLSLKI